MARATATDRKADKNAELAAERAAIVEKDIPEVAEEVKPLRANETWRRLQKNNPMLNPWMSPAFLVDMWSQASDIEIPLLEALPGGSEIAELRKACGLSIEAVAERACVTADMWEAFEYGDDSVLDHININQALRFVSALDACVIAGGPPSPAPAEPVPERKPMTIVGAELLSEVAREAGDRFPLSHVILDDRMSRRIAQGEIPSPTAASFPTEKEMVEILLAFPGLANRLRPVVWTNSSLLQDLLDREPTDAEYIPRDELGVGRAGLLRVIGTAKAILDADPDRIQAIAEAREAFDKRRQEQEATSARARSAAAQAALLLAQAKYDEASSGDVA